MVVKSVAALSGAAAAATMDVHLDETAWLFHCRRHRLPNSELYATRDEYRKDDMALTK